MTTKKAVTKKDSPLICRILKAPLRILVKAKDFYMQSMIICDGQMGYGGGMGCPTGHVTTLPKSFSVNSSKSYSSDEDLRGLVRAASTRGVGKKIDLDVQRRQEKNNDAMPRSASVGFGRIDEDEPCEFFGNEPINVKTNLYPRSRSHAVSSFRR